MLSRRFDRAATAEGFSRMHFMSGLTLLGLHENDASRGSCPALADSIRKLVNDFKQNVAASFWRRFNRAELKFAASRPGSSSAPLLTPAVAPTDSSLRAGTILILFGCARFAPLPRSSFPAA